MPIPRLHVVPVHSIEAQTHLDLSRPYRNVPVFVKEPEGSSPASHAERQGLCLSESHAAEFDYFSFVPNSPIHTGFRLTC